MLIQITIKRKNGSKCEIDKTHYHFKANDKGDHVCDVTNDKHIQRFLSIDGYKTYQVEDEVSIDTDNALLSDGMTDDEMKAYAIDKLGIENPEDKDELLAYADEIMDVKLNKNKKSMNLLIDIINYKAPGFN